MTNFDDLMEKVWANRAARTAAIENNLRRELGVIFEQKVKTIAHLLKLANISATQAKRLLHRELGGNLNLKTIIKAADALGLTVDIKLSEKTIGEKK